MFNKKTSIRIFTVRLLNTLLKPIQMPINRRVDKLCYAHITESFMYITMNKLLLHATTWVNLKNITLSKRNQTHCSIRIQLHNIQRTKLNIQLEISIVDALEWLQGGRSRLGVLIMFYFLIWAPFIWMYSCLFCEVL